MLALNLSKIRTAEERFAAVYPIGALAGDGDSYRWWRRLTWRSIFSVA